MPTIPRRLYAHIEKKLRSRGRLCIHDARKEVALCKSDAAALQSPAVGLIGSKGGISNRTQSAAVKIIHAEEQLDAALRWADVYAQLDRIFEGTPEGEIAEMLYELGMTQAAVAKERGVDRQTINRLRDTYVTHAALLAVEAGLVAMSEYTRERERTSHENE